MDNCPYKSIKVPSTAITNKMIKILKRKCAIFSLRASHGVDRRRRRSHRIAASQLLAVGAVYATRTVLLIIIAFSCFYFGMSRLSNYFADFIINFKFSFKLWKRTDFSTEAN
jgi:hypothetical protein